MHSRCVDGDVTGLALRYPDSGAQRSRLLAGMLVQSLSETLLAVVLSYLKKPGMLYGKILTSPHAHARILRIDTSKAEVFREAVAAGASILNDVTALAGDPAMPVAAAAAFARPVRPCRRRRAGAVARPAPRSSPTMKPRWGCWTKR